MAALVGSWGVFVLLVLVPTMFLRLLQQSYGSKTVLSNSSNSDNSNSSNSSRSSRSNFSLRQLSRSNSNS